MLPKTQTESAKTLAESVVDRLNTAFAAKDIDGFVGSFTESAEVWALGEDRPLLRGKKALRGAYSRIFASRPSQKLEVLDRIAHEGTIIQKERTVDDDNRPRENVVIYKVVGKRVTRVWISGED